jgi:hypothetical protein
MAKDSWGASATIATSGLGCFGVRALCLLPDAFAASGIDSRNYFDAYLGIFTDSAATAFIEAGIGFYGEVHRNKQGKIVDSMFPGCWSTLVNPLGGALHGNKAQGQRNEQYLGPNRVEMELIVSAANTASFKVNGRAFRGAPTFTYGFGGRGVADATYAKGFNIKACIGLHDADRTVRFTDMRMEIKQVATRGPGGALSWGPPKGMAYLSGLPGAVVRAMGPQLSVSYNAPSLGGGLGLA